VFESGHGESPDRGGVSSDVPDVSPDACGPPPDNDGVTPDRSGGFKDGIGVPSDRTGESQMSAEIVRMTEAGSRIIAAIVQRPLFLMELILPITGKIQTMSYTKPDAEKIFSLC